MLKTATPGVRAPLLKALSAEFVPKGLRFAQAKADEDEAAPSIRPVSVGGAYNIPEEISQYEGKMDFDGLKGYLKQCVSWLKRARKQTRLDGKAKKEEL